MRRDLLVREEYRWRMAQAERTRAPAVRDAAEGDFAWACFKAQQAAECALKALPRGLGVRKGGHAITELLKAPGELGFKVSEALEGSARNPDLHCIPTRYPDALPGGSPFDPYDREKAEEALDDARQILEWVKRSVA